MELNRWVFRTFVNVLTETDCLILIAKGRLLKEAATILVISPVVSG